MKLPNKQALILGRILIIFWLLCFVFAACKSKKIVEPSETIIARVGDKSISLNEFIRRAEYTVRPPYCRDDNPVHKKIVLNSLIAEKLLALEASDAAELNNNFEFQEYLKGRKEQAMRQWNYKIEGLDKVIIDTLELKKAFKYAGRTYRVSYINLPNLEVASLFEKEMTNNKSQFEETFRKLADSDSIPEKQISWDSPEADSIHEALFSDSLKVGQVIGPLRINQSNHLIMRINGWTTKVAISETHVKQRWSDVKEKMTQIKAAKIYTDYVSKIMRGKELVFNEDIFKKMVNIIGPQYYLSDEEKQESFNKKFWNKDRQEMILDDLENRLEQIRNQPFFSIDDKTWTVQDYETALISHPLVFRRKGIPKNEFAEEFKLAIVDMVRDQYLTQDAYRKGIDKVNVVQRDYQMWRDNLLSIYQKYHYLNSLGVKENDQYQVIKQYLDPYVNDLQKKYHDSIEINTDAFNDISLTRIDMFVIQKNVPFPIIVPSFPSVTTDDRLDYGRRMIR